MKHNMEQEGIEADRKRKENGGPNSSTVNGVTLNAYAKMEQENKRNS